MSAVASDVDPFFKRPKFFVRRSTGGVKLCKLSHLLYVHGTDLRLFPQSTTIGSGVMSSGNVAMSSFVEKIVSVHRCLIPTEVERPPLTTVCGLFDQKMAHWWFESAIVSPSDWHASAGTLRQRAPAKFAQARERLSTPSSGGLSQAVSIRTGIARQDVRY